MNLLRNPISQLIDGSAILQNFIVFTALTITLKPSINFKILLEPLISPLRA